MKTIALFGAGKIGEAIAALFSASGRYRLKVCDINKARAEQITTGLPHCEAHELKLSDPVHTRTILSNCALVISALPFFCNRSVAEAAFELGIHYADLTEDVEVSKFIEKLATTSKGCFMPQCGLAPGFISIAAAHLASLFDSVDTLKLRTGALPMYPANRLMYNLTWSTEGLINEYCHPCEIIQDGRRLMVPALEHYETFSLDGEVYEAFNTSGGLGGLCEALDGKVQNLNYKTIRYIGHRELVCFLLHDLKFEHDRETLKEVLERSVPTTAQDKCIIFVSASGISKGVRTQKTYASRVYNKSIGGRHFSAIQITTAAGICAPIDLLLSGEVPKTTGLVRPSDISLPKFLSNEFGSLYRDEQALAALL